MLIDDYLNYDSEYKKLYNKSLVLMQVGSFYELYSLNKDEIDRVCNLLEIQSTKKNKNKPDVDKNNPYMAGVPLYVIDKYINILTDNGYTIILELRKDNIYYQRGHLDDPASFNYGAYKTNP